MRPAAPTTVAALTTVIAAAALVASACTSTQTGQASPPSSQTAESSASSSSAAPNDLIGLNACTLLTDAEAQQAVPGVGTHQDMGDLGGPGTSDCSWTKPATNDSAAQTFGITVRPTQGLKDIVVKPGGQLSNTTTTGGRQAILLKNDQGEGSCAGGIAVGPGRIDINDEAVGVNSTTESACAVVNKIADYVEPRLPAS